MYRSSTYNYSAETSSNQSCENYYIYQLELNTKVGSRYLKGSKGPTTKVLK